MALTEIKTSGVAADAVTAAKSADDAVGAEHIEVLDAALQLGDDVKAQFGAGNDLEVFHDATHSRIHNNTGSLLLECDGTAIEINSGSSTENMAKFVKDGAVELYHNNSKKLETTSGGAEVFGELQMDDANSHIKIPDNARIDIGNGPDLKIYHDATNSHIKSDTNALVIRSDALRCNNNGNTETMIKADADGAVELYHDNSKKLSTISAGAYVAGTLGVGDASNPGHNYNQGIHVHANGSGAVLHLTDTNSGSGVDDGFDILSIGDAYLWQRENANMIFGTNATERMRIDSSGNLLIGATASEDTTGNSGPKLLHTGDIQIDGDQKSLVFRSTANTAQKQSGIQWWNENGAGVQSAIFGIREAVNQAPGALAFYTSDNVDSASNNSEGNIAERVRIDSSGNFGVGTTAPHNSDSADGGWHVKPSGSNGGPSMAFKRPDTSNTTYAASFVNGTTGVGWITYTNSSTAYTTASDYRLKENVIAISDGITRLKTLKPSRFNFKVDKDKKVDGFLAHEVTAVPEAITGTKDEVDADKKPVYQAIDQSKLVPLLTAALQEAIAKIEVLETKVAALEAK